jgi:hypothetical protein
MWSFGTRLNSVISLLLSNEIRARPLMEKNVGPPVPTPPPQQGRCRPTGSEWLGDKAGIVEIFRSLLRLEIWLVPWIRGPI